MNSGEDQHSHHSDHHIKQDDKNEVQHMTNEIKSAVQELDDSSSSGSSASDTGSAACNGQYKIASKKNSVKDDENGNETDTSIDGSEDEDESESDDESDGDEDDDEDDDDNDDDEDDVIRGIRRMRRGAEYFDSDSSDDQSDRCPICLNRFIYQEVGTPESCDHNFCLDCIQEWARNVNTCPVDRQVFTLILVRPKLDTHSKISRKIIIENKQLEDEEDVEEDQTFCEICGSSDREDRLLLCDGCDLGYHLECLDPPLDSVPVEEWFCPDCSIENQLPLAEEVGIREDELAGLLGDNPPDLGLPVLRPRGRRLVPRTRQSERVRRRILRNRNTALSNGVSEDQTSHSGIESQQNVTKKTSVRRKRITGTKRKKKRTRKKKKTLKKIGLVGAKKSTRKRRRRKKRKLKKGKKTGGVKARVVLPLSIKARIANHLGLKKPPPGHSLPLMRSVSHPKTLNHQRHDVGIPTLNIFGSRDELDVFPESYSDGDVLISLPSLPQAIPRNKLRASSLILSHHRISESMRSSRRIMPQVPFQAHSEPVTFDVVGSILNGQSVLHTKSKDIAISRDGSLNVLPRFTDKQLVHQRPASPNPSSKGGGRTGSSNAPISSCPGQNYSGERPGYGHWSSLLNENESNQAYAEYYRTANSNDETRTFSGSGDECSGNNGHNNNAKDKNKKNEKEKKPVTNEYDDIDIYSDIEPGFENDETYSGIEDSMATSMDLVQDDCINHSDISSEDDLVIDESIKQDDYDDNDDDDDGNSELKQRSLMEQANSEENISSSSENDLIIDEEPHHNKTEITNIATGVHKNFDEQNETDSSDSDQVTEELEKVSQEFSKQKDYSNNFLEESNEKGTDSDDGDEGEDKSDNDLASECSQSQRDTRVSEEQEQSDIDIDVECVTEQEHSDVDVEDSSPQPNVSYDVNDIDLPVEREKNSEVKEDQNDDANEDQDDERVSGDENEDVDVGSDHSPCSEIDEKLEEQENYSLSTKEINNRIQQEVIRSIEELNNSNCCTDSKQEESEKELLSTEVNTVDQMENAEIVPSEENPAEKQCTEIAHNLCSIMDDSCQISENKDIKNTDYEHEIIEEGEIPNTEESERKKYRRKKEASQHSSSRRSHHTSSKSHRDSGDHEEGEIVDDSPPRRSKDRNKLKNVLRDVSPDEYDYDMPRKNISELPRIPKIKRDKTVKEGTEPMIPISVDSKRTSVLSRLDIGSANEISWKKLSKSSKERNYRDGKPKDETKYFREREIKEKKDDKKRKADSVDKKEKKPSDHERHKNDWPREKEKDKRDKRSVEKDRHKEKHRNKHKEKEKERHKHNRPTEIVPEKRKERDRREREMHEKREKPEKKEKEKKEKREKSRSGERSHRDEKHREHKKKVEKVVLASRETSPIESKEVYTSGDSIIVNVSFNRSLQREGKSREGKTKNKENRESKRTFPPESSSREHKKIRISEPEVIWSEKPKEIPLEKVIKNYPPQSPPSSPPLPPPPPREHKRKPESVRKEVISPEPPRPSIIKWKPICEEEEDDEITEIVTSEKSLKSNESDSQDCVVTEEIENIESPNEPETLPSDAENDVADDNENLVEIHSPHEKINEDSTATNEPPEEQLESPPSPTDDSVYDPFEPTKSPSLSPVLSETKSTNDPNANNDTILPPPLPELPPLPPEPEPLEPPPPIPVNKDISHSSPSFTMQIPPKIPPQLSASPVSLPNVRIPPPNFIPRAVPPNGTTAMQIAPPLRPIGWPVGTPGVIYTAPAQSIIRGGFLPPTLTTAPVPVSTQSVSLNQIGTLLHTQAQLAILSAVRPPSGPPLSAVPPTIAIPPPLLSCPPPQLAPTTIPIQQPISNATQNGETRRPIVQQPDVTEVVDMEMESPYSPGEDVPEIPSPEKKSISVSVHSEKSKDKFDLLLGTVKSIASRQQEKQPTHITRGRVSNDRTSRQSSQQRLDNRSISNAVSDSRKRSSENYSSSSSKKHIVRFEIPDRKAAQKKDKKLEEGGKKEVTLRLDETQLKILDELPSSAVEMQVKEKFLKKLNRQERVIEEVKLAIKPYYNRREISKEDYKEILRKSVPKICHNKSGEINPVKIRALVEGYVRKFKYHHKKETKFQPMGGKKS